MGLRINCMKEKIECFIENKNKSILSTKYTNFIKEFFKIAIFLVNFNE